MTPPCSRRSGRGRWRTSSGGGLCDWPHGRCSRGACGPGAGVPVRNDGGFMVDREKVLAVLTRRFPGSRPDQLAAAANAIVGLDEEWEDVSDRLQEFGDNYSAHCS